MINVMSFDFQLIAYILSILPFEVSALGNKLSA